MFGYVDRLFVIYNLFAVRLIVCASIYKRRVFMKKQTEYTFGNGGGNRQSHSQTSGGNSLLFSLTSGGNCIITLALGGNRLLHSKTLDGNRQSY